MTLVTIRILDGPDRGKKFPLIATPVTVGREEGNLIQLNDLRASRNHLKIHESNDAILMTDLQSTNGTKVNGESVRVWKLLPGDLITVGRSLLLFGSTTDIVDRLAELNGSDLSAAVPMGVDYDEKDFQKKSANHTAHDWTQSSHLLAKEIFGFTGEETELLPLQMLTLPSLPNDLPPLAAAQIEAFLQFIHIRLRHIIASVRAVPAQTDESSSQARITITARQWQNIIDLHAQISTLMSEHPASDKDP